MILYNVLKPLVLLVSLLPFEFHLTVLFLSIITTVYIKSEMLPVWYIKLKHDV